MTPLPPLSIIKERMIAVFLVICEVSVSVLSLLAPHKWKFLKQLRPRMSLMGKTLSSSVHKQFLDLQEAKQNTASCAPPPLVGVRCACLL